MDQSAPIERPPCLFYAEFVGGPHDGLKFVACGKHPLDWPLMSMMYRGRLVWYQQNGWAPGGRWLYRHAPQLVGPHAEEEVSNKHCIGR